MNATSKLVKAWESKNAKNAVKAGGISLMALSLAACGGSSTPVADAPAADPVVPVVPVAQTLTLTVGVDAVTGGAGDDTITGNSIANTAGGATVNNSTLTALDAIDGGAGTDTLTVTEIGNFAAPAGATVVNVETANITATGTVTANASTWTGLTSLTTTGVGLSTITGAATTDLTITAATVGLAEVSVNGGNDVDLTVTGFAAVAATPAGGVAVGGTTAAAGDVVVNVTGAAGNVAGTTATNTGIAVTGGDTITVNQLAANAVNTTVTSSEVNIVGGATTTAVTVTNAAATATASATVAEASVGAAIAINDAGAAGATADTIATVTLDNFGATTITSSALSTLNVTGGINGKASGALTLNLEGTVTPATTLTLNSSGGLMGAITGTQMDDYTTVNVNSSDATTISAIQADLMATLNFTGAGNTTVTTMTMDGGQNDTLADINVTGAGGVSIGSAIGVAVAFDGGAGNDTVSLGATTKAITMGAGDDTVTSAGLVGTGGTVAAGDGTDTIIMTSDEAEVADGSSVFNTKFTGFEVLRLSDAMDGATLDLDGVNSVDHVILAAGTDASAVFSNMSSGGRVEFVADAANDLTVNVTSAIVSASDVLNIELTGSDIDGGTVTAANVETINVIMSDGATPIAANAGALILTAAAATSVVVTGNSGVAITATGSVLVTDFDASAIIANSSAATAATYSSAAAAATTDTAAELAVTYTSVNTTANAAVSIKGGAGNDVLTGSGAAVNVDTITGGEGADTYTGGTGNDVLILTETTDAIDTVVIATTANNGTDTIKGFQAGTAGKDVVSLVDTLTDDGTASGADAVVASVAVALTSGAAVYATAVNANAQDVIEITTTLSSFGDLDKAGATTGTELLKALSSTDAAATSISTATALADGVFIAAYQDGDAFLYQVTDDGSDNATITAAEIALVAIIEDVTAGALTSGDFVLA